MGLQKKDSYDDIFNKNVNTYFEQPKLNGIATLISRVFNEEMRNQRTAYWFLTARKRSEGHRDYWSLFVPELVHYRFISRTIEKGYKPHVDPNVNLDTGEILKC